MLQNLGFPMQNYHEESFGSSRKAKKPKQEVKIQPAPNETLSPHNGIRQLLGKLLATPAVEQPTLKEATVIEPSVAFHSTSSVSTSQLSLVFSKSGKEVTCDGEEPILNLAELEGVKIRSSCRSG